MISESNYILKKEVDWSLFTAGVTIPIENQVVFGQIFNRYLRKGEKKPVKLIFNNKTYDAHVTNVNYSEKFNRRSEVLQLRYNRNSDFANDLRNYFNKTYNYIVQEKNNLPKKAKVRLPDEYKDYLVFYTTIYDDTYLCEPILSQDFMSYNSSLKETQEENYEQILNNITDDTATIYTAQRIQKVRKLNQMIITNLKMLYNYRCQICGRNVGEEYSAIISEAHHIDYFVKSYNNDADNIIILCPNHHRIIHSVNPLFNRVNKEYNFNNGTILKLVLNKHL